MKISAIIILTLVSGCSTLHCNETVKMKDDETVSVCHTMSYHMSQNKL